MHSFDAEFSGPLLPLNPSGGYRASVVRPAHHDGCPSDSSAASASLTLSLLCWNLLAPPYKRLTAGGRESDDAWHERVAEQIAVVRKSNADVVALQEFWCANRKYVEMWERFAVAEGYTMFISPRTNGKQDGCCLLVRNGRASILGRPSLRPEGRIGVEPEGEVEPGMVTLSYNDWGNRIAQAVRIVLQGRPLTILHTHLTFPHPSPHDGPMRLHQARKLAEYVRRVTASGVPAVVCGDLNGGPSDPAIALLQRSASLELMPGAKESESVSHVAHDGRLMACDLALTSSGCCVGRWHFGGSQRELLARQSLSDHRPLYCSITLDAEAAA